METINSKVWEETCSRNCRVSKHETDEQSCSTSRPTGAFRFILGSILHPLTGDDVSQAPYTHVHAENVGRLEYSMCVLSIYISLKYDGMPSLIKLWITTESVACSCKQKAPVIDISKLLIETKPIACLPWEILHYKISREKLQPEPGFEPWTSEREIWTWAGMRTRIAQVAERRARNPEDRGSNPGSGSSFSLEIL